MICVKPMGIVIVIVLFLLSCAEHENYSYRSPWDGEVVELPIEPNFGFEEFVTALSNPEMGDRCIEGQAGRDVCLYFLAVQSNGTQPSGCVECVYEASLNGRKLLENKRIKAFSLEDWIIRAFEPYIKEKIILSSGGNDEVVIRYVRDEVINEYTVNYAEYARIFKLSFICADGDGSLSFCNTVLGSGLKPAAILTGAEGVGCHAFSIHYQRGEILINPDLLGHYCEIWRLTDYTYRWGGQ